MEKIKCAFIFEILGRPPEHIKESLEEFIDRIGKVKEISIVRKIIHGLLLTGIHSHFFLNTVK